MRMIYRTTDSPLSDIENEQFMGVVSIHFCFSSTTLFLFVASGKANLNDDVLSSIVMVFLSTRNLLVTSTD